MTSNFEEPIPFEEITIENTINEGGFGSILKCIWKGKYYALKKISNKLKYSFDGELKALV